MQVNLVVSEPLLTLKEYARRTGQGIDAVKKQADKQIIPTVQPNGVKQGRFVNMVELSMRCINYAEQQPKHLKTWG